MARTLPGLALLVLAAACGRSSDGLGPLMAGARGDAMLGRWEKVERSMPPITLDVRRSSASVTGHEGQVWLSGVTYTLPATHLDDTSLVLANPVSSGPPRVVAVLKDGVLRVRLSGHDREERLVRRNLSE